MTEITCCRNCTKRELGCHATCEEYLTARKSRDDYLFKRYKQSVKVQDAKRYIREAIERAKK